MTYCPYCGASILDDAAFCMECGKTIPLASAQKAEPEKASSRQNAGKKKSRARLQKKRPGSTEKKPKREPGCDGYYDDVLPTDEGSFGDKMDPALLKQIILVGCGALTVVLLTVLLMQLL